MAQSKVKFARLNQTTYDGKVTAKTIDEDTVYFCLDSGRVYQGSTLVGEAGGSINRQFYQSTSTHSSVLGQGVLGEMVLGQS